MTDKGTRYEQFKAMTNQELVDLVMNNEDIPSGDMDLIKAVMSIRFIFLVTEGFAPEWEKIKDRKYSVEDWAADKVAEVSGNGRE